MQLIDTSPASEQEPRLEALFRPGLIGRLQLKNRVLMAPMEKNLCTADGVVTQRYIDYLLARARADVGLLRVEATYVDPLGKGRPYQLGAYSDHVIPALSRMVSEVHSAGGKISVELAHCGRQTNSLITGRQPVAPSAVPCELSGGYLPRALTVAEIGEIIERFAEAARRAQKAGVDAIEIHGASGYLINAFTSPYTNLRDDEYGGSHENRMRLPLEVVAAVKSAVGSEMPILYRMCADEFVTGGLTVSETGPLAAHLERAGVDLIDVSAGTYESILATQPPMESEPGTLLSIAAAIKRHVQIPVATGGKLGDLDIADRAIAAGDIDFATIGRSLHADPELLVKSRSGRIDQVRRCIACAECVAFLGENRPAYCAVNPSTVRERALRVGAAAIRRRVVVVGGGPAGLEAARAAALKGHSVRLFERQERLGGRARHGALVVGRSAFAEPTRFLERELERLRVRIHRGVELDAETIKMISPDVAIFATGAGAGRRQISGRELGHLITASEYLDWEERRLAAADTEAAPAPLANATSIVVVGGCWIGCHVASLLMARGLAVAIVETRAALGYDMGDQQGAVLRNRVANDERNSGIYLRSTVEEITRGHMSIWRSDLDESARLVADAIVVVEPRQPNRELADIVAERCGDAVEVHAIGDCVQPRKLQDALLEGATVGAAI
jgi:2,4-dienoyl-CoA reductase-like NADH-dependent reductase (Old Yellow Enzyme family)/ribulose 1,5-bisphosphate synthetase/thiazole synthase